MKYIGYLAVIITFLFGAFAVSSYFESQRYEEEVHQVIRELLLDLPNQKQYSALGAYKSCPASEGNSVEINVIIPVKAAVELECDFDNGKATIYVKLEQINNGWQIEKLQVNSNVFSSAFNK